jgi:endoglucanase
VGEYGAPNRNKDPESVRLYLLTVAGTAYRLGMCPMLWDAGGHFNRRTLEFDDPELAKGYRKLSGEKR